MLDDTDWPDDQEPGESLCTIFTDKKKHSKNEISTPNTIDIQMVVIWSVR